MANSGPTCVQRICSMISGRHTLGTLLALCAMLVCGASSAPPNAWAFLPTAHTSQPAREPQWIKEYPLWKTLPTSAFAVLREGTVARSRWGIYAYRGDGPAGGSRPCIEEVNLTFEGGLSTSGSSCGPLPTGDKPPIFTLTGLSWKYPGRAVIGETVIGMVVSKSVSRVSINVNPVPKVVRRTRYLSVSQARKARIQRFRYVALAIPRDVCLMGVEGFDIGGRRVLNTGLDPCLAPG